MKTLIKPAKDDINKVGGPKEESLSTFEMVHFLKKYHSNVSSFSNVILILSIRAIV